MVKCSVQEARMQPNGLALVNLFVRPLELVDLFGICFAAVGRF